MTLIDKAEALEPCPFCRKTPDPPVDATRILGVWRVIHKGCTVLPNFSVERDSKSEAIAAWNRRALPAAVPVVTWHPFDTAPRDGSRFLAQGGGLDAVDICSYNARVGCWDCGAVTLDDTDHEPEGYNRPAQWMPLTALAPSPARDVREAAWDAAVYNMDRSQQFKDGAAWGIRKSIAWLHHRATEMNDPHAEAILNTAATNLGMWKGWHVRHRKHRSLIGEPRT